MKDGFGRTLIDDAEFGGPLISVKHLWFGQLLTFIHDSPKMSPGERRNCCEVLMEVPQEVKDCWPGIFQDLCTCGHLTVSHTGLSNLCRRCDKCEGFSPTANYGYTHAD